MIKALLNFLSRPTPKRDSYYAAKSEQTFANNSATRKLIEKYGNPLPPFQQAPGAAKQLKAAPPPPPTDAS